MNITSIRMAFNAGGFETAIAELSRYPEIGRRFKKHFFEAQKLVGLPYWPRKLEQGTSEFEYCCMELLSLYKTHETRRKDFEELFFVWLETQEIGFDLPRKDSQRLDVLRDLMRDDEKCFVFGAGPLTAEQRFLVDFGLADQQQSA